MTALLIIGIVLLSLGLIVLILLFCPVRADVFSDSEDILTYDIKYLFFDLASQEKSGGEAQENDENAKEKTPLGETVKTLISALKSLGALLPHIRIDKFKVNWVCAGSDAAETAIRYGTVCAVIYPLAAFLKEKTHYKKNPDISVTADFEAQNGNYSIYLKLRAPLVFAINFLLQTALDINLKGGLSNAGKT